jgi:hypothetical protein
MFNYLESPVMAGGLLMFVQYGTGSFSLDDRSYV